MTHDTSKQPALGEPVSDQRPARGGWAPGGYQIAACAECRRPFCGDKRARQCADCAYAEQPDGEVDSED